jgi:hypothetical protein
MWGRTDPRGCEVSYVPFAFMSPSSQAHKKDDTSLGIERTSGPGCERAGSLGAGGGAGHRSEFPMPKTR